MSTGRSDLTDVDALPWPVEIRPHPTARHVRLRIDEARARLVLTHPRRMSRHTALDWAAKQGEWAMEQLARLVPSVPFAPGSSILLEGREVEIDWVVDAPRTPSLVGDRLRCGGPVESLSGRIERYLKNQARHRLSERTAACALRAGVSVKSVSVGDTRSRWGSCSSTGAIRYNWRLVMAPPHLLDWVVAHEVAHRRHMDHGPAFKALEAELFDGDVAAARAELRALGPRLKRIGRPV